jgi:hypothetical protein
VHYDLGADQLRGEIGEFTVDLLHEPCSDQLGGGIGETCNVIECSVVNMINNGLDDCVKIPKVGHEAVLGHCATKSLDRDIDHIVVAVDPVTLVFLGNVGEPVGGTEWITLSYAGLHLKLH